MWQFVLLYESLKAAIKHQHQVEWNLQTAGKVTCCQRVANYFVLFINRKGGASLQQEVFCPTSFLRPSWTWLIAEPSRSARTRILSTASKEMFGQMNHGIKYVNPLSFLFLPSVGGRSSNWRFRTFMEIYGTIMSFFLLPYSAKKGRVTRSNVWMDVCRDNRWSQIKRWAFVQKALVGKLLGFWSEKSLIHLPTN